MFDKNKFIYDILNVDTNGEEGYIRIGELLDSLGFVVDYKKSKKAGTVKGKGFECKNEKGAITLNGKNAKVIANFIIKENTLRGILKSSEGTVVLNTNEDVVIARYYDKTTTEIAEKLNLAGKYGIENTHGINPDGTVKFKTADQIGKLAEMLQPKSKTLAKTKK